MKKIIVVLVLSLIISISSVSASLPLAGKTIVIDVGHGGKDMGSSYGNIYEKDINLSISNRLKDELIRNGANVLMVRDGDYDLASPDINRRKKNDFDNRIKMINESNANLYLSIHTNYLANPNYYGAQVFYTDNNERLASCIQARLNTISYPREYKNMPNVYMYQKLKIKGVLIEVGFLSNSFERNNLIKDEYQKKLAEQISLGIIDYCK